jgi:hypothetical protein
MLEPFRCLFTAPTWKKMLTLLRGTLLARGRRTVTAALWHTGHEQDPHFSAFHQVLNRARWSPLQASRQLLTLIIQTFAQAGGSLDIAIEVRVVSRAGYLDVRLHHAGLLRALGQPPSLNESGLIHRIPFWDRKFA